MFGFLGKRSLAALPMLIMVLLATFLMLHALPGDPAEALAGRLGTAESIAKLRVDMGLDRPLPEQFGSYVGDVLSGDLGSSNRTRKPVVDELKARIPATIELAALAMLFATIIGVSLGVLSSLKPRGWFDLGTLFVALAGVSLPIFWLGLMVIELLQPNGHLTSWFGFSGLDIGGRHSSEWNLSAFAEYNTNATGFYTYDTLFVMKEPDAFFDVLSHLLVPAIVLATVPAALITRITRAAVGEVMLQDYIRTARAKGLPTGKVVVRHALRNALIPIVTTVGTQFGYLLGGAVLTETIFGWPGLGTYIIDAINNRDPQPLQGAVLFVALVFLAVNFLVDVTYALIDPRVRKKGA